MSLKPKTEDALKTFWMSHLDNTGDKYISDCLEESFSALITAIECCPSLVSNLNTFIENAAKKKTPTIRFGHESVYIPEENTAYIAVGEQLYSTVNRETLLNLAHEMGHAISTSGGHAIDSNGKVDLDKVSLAEYADLINLKEGEAIFFELKALEALQKLYPGQTYERGEVWLDGEANHISGHDFYQTASDIMLDGNLSEAEKMVQLGQQVNSQIIRGIMEPSFGVKTSTPVLLTYDEFEKLTWLFSRSDMAIDYLEAFGINGYARGNKDTGHAAINKIYEMAGGGLDLKVLVNRAHKILGGGTNYYGTNGNDTLMATRNGSELGGINGREVLWGGNGDDVLHGSSKKDILMGGDDNDKLYGDGGDDYLAGNQGNDILFGGSGDDTLFGGSGHDRLYGGEDDDTYHFDLADLNGCAPDIIRDEGGVGTIVVQAPGFSIPDAVRTINLGEEGIKRKQGELENTYEDEQDERIWYRFQAHADPKENEPIAEQEGSLFIYFNDTLVAVVKDYKSGQLGLTLPEEAAPEATPVAAAFDPKFGRYIQLRDEVNPETMLKIDLAAGDDPKIEGGPADVVIGSSDSEEVWLGKGHDYFLGQGGADIVHGGAGNDYIAVRHPEDVNPNDSGIKAFGGKDRDMIIGGSGDDILIGGDSMYEAEVQVAETHEAEKSGDIISGGDGHDRIYGSQDRDLLCGGNGADYIAGNGGADLIFGDAGADFLYGGKGEDVLYADGNDFLTAGGRPRLKYFWVSAKERPVSMKKGEYMRSLFGMSSFGKRTKDN